jgi:hypothetical protein
VDPSVVDALRTPGRHLRDDPEPLTMAKELAVDLEADLCSTQQEADDLLAELAAFPPLGADGILLVRRLAQRVTAAQRIVDRTLDRAAADVGGRLATIGSGVAVHPTTVRERAASVVAARAALEAADDRLRTATEAGEAAVEATPEPEPEAAPVDVAATAEPRPERRRWPWFGRRRARARYEEDTSESTSLLQQVAASTDEAFGARRANAVRSDRLVVLQAQRDRAEEDVRVAERAWHDLAGDDDVEDVEAVVRRFDPQHEETRALAQGSVGVRAASALLARAMERWEEGWRSLGVDPAPAADDAWAEQLAERMARPIVVVAEATARQADLVAAAPAAPVVVVEERATS